MNPFTHNIKEMFSFRMPRLLSGTQTSIDMKSMLETMRRNAQAMTEAHRLALESYQTLTQRQSEILSQILEDHSEMARTLMTEGTPEEKVSRQAALSRKVYERTTKGLRELSDILSEAQNETVELLNKRVLSTLSDVQKMMDQSGAVATRRAA